MTVVNARRDRSAHLCRIMRTHGLYLLLPLLLHACGTPTPDATDGGPDAVTVPPAPPAVDTRWEVNDATREGVQAMRHLVEGYPANGLRQGALKDTLEAHLTLIFERCTMDGEGHERLHEFLLPLYHQFRELPPEPAAGQVAAIREHLEGFGQVFR